MRFDEIFSIWILVWFILYCIGFVPYSPKFVLIIGLIHNFILLTIMIINHARFLTTIQFFFIIFITKILPLLLLRNVALKVDDVIFSLIYFNVYLVWLCMNGKDFYDNIVISINSSVNDKTDTPIMGLFSKLEKYLKG